MAKIRDEIPKLEHFDISEPLSSYEELVSSKRQAILISNATTYRSDAPLVKNNREIQSLSLLNLHPHRATEIAFHFISSATLIKGGIIQLKQSLSDSASSLQIAHSKMALYYSESLGSQSASLDFLQCMRVEVVGIRAHLKIQHIMLSHLVQQQSEHSDCIIVNAKDHSLGQILVLRRK
ncbi:MAG: hypothetical protein GOMPHAMPRED_004673 [Gomphillus americanus]|uniref:Uncharacterized protein n=1 Tax=Gomphillus americanus TaxID=1940652 RepID=A0A8H3FPL5_9LECA|nr:MAG: hypothetical protein GOMPHAMPRED_004673 [Gomphillus americanus]